MDSTFIHQKANELVLRAGSRDLRTIAKTVGMDVTEMPFVPGSLRSNGICTRSLSMLRWTGRPSKWYAAMH